MNIDEVVVRKDLLEKARAGDQKSKEEICISLESINLDEHIVSYDRETEVIVGLRDLNEWGILDSITLTDVKPFTYG